MSTDGNPVVYAEKTADPAAPTVLVYGHYDVMPVNPAGEWTNGPFDPVIREGRIWARGANDDKGQSYMHLKAMEAMLATGTLPCNLKFMLEGEEEIGSASLGKWCTEHQELLKARCDPRLGHEPAGVANPVDHLRPARTVLYGNRGDRTEQRAAFGTVRRGRGRSGQCAGQADRRTDRRRGPHHDPALLRYRARTEPAEREAFGKAPFCEAAYRKGLGIRSTQGETGYTTMERTGIRPSLDVNGIWSGYTGEGTKTVIPSKACAKISMRLVPDQDYRQIARLFEEYMQALAPAGVSVNVRALHGGSPYLTPTDLPAYRAAAAAVEETFGKEPLPYYSGGSIPIISTFEKVLGLKSVLLGFGLDQDAIHSPNESYALENFYRGVDTIARFHRHFAAILKSHA